MKRSHESKQDNQAEAFTHVVDTKPPKDKTKNLRKVGKNAFWLFISLLILGIAQFVVLGLISRFGGVEKAGIWAYVSAFRDPFAVFMDFGTTRLLVAEIARRQDEADILLGNGLTLGLVVGLPVLIVMIISANLPFFDHSPLLIQGIYMMGLGALLYTTSASFRSAFRAFNRFEYEAFISILTATLLMGGAFIVLYFGLPFVWLFIIFAIAQFSALMWAWWTYNRRLGKFKLAFDRRVIPHLLNKTWAFTMIGLLNRAFTRIDVIILRFFQGASAAGYYALATTIFYQMNTIAQLASTAILPTMAKAFVTQPEKIGRQLDTAVRLQVLVGLPCTIIGLVVAPQIIRLLYGSGYDNSTLIFQLLLLVVVLRFVNQTLGIALTAMDEQGKRAAMLGLTVIFNITANILLIPYWSFLGATIVAVLSEILLFGSTYLMLVPRVRQSIQWGRLIRPTIGALSLLPLLYLLREWPLLILLSLGSTLYILLIFLFRSFSTDESITIAQQIQNIGPIPLPLRQRLSSFVTSCARD